MPSEQLQLYAEHIWVLKADPEQQARREILIPTGRPSLVFNLGQPGVYIDPLSDQQRRNDNIYFNVATRPFIIEQHGEAHYVGVELKPYGLTAFMKRRQAPNTSGFLTELFGASALDQLITTLRKQDSGTLSAQITDTFLMHYANVIPARDLARLQSGIGVIERCGGAVNATEVAHEIAISPSTLRRVFDRYVGISPEQLIQITRFSSFVRGLIQNKGGSSSYLLGALHGYYDESHAAKDFKKYTGLNRKAFLNMYDGIARLMYESD